MDTNCLAIKRMMHMLEDEDGNSVDTEDLNEPYLLVALHTSNMVQHMLSLQITSSTYTWTRNMIHSLQNYAQWQESKVSVVKTLSLHMCMFGCVTVRVFHVYSARYSGNCSWKKTSAGRGASWQRRGSVTGCCRAT